MSALWCFLPFRAAGFPAGKWLQCSIFGRMSYDMLSTETTLLRHSHTADLEPVDGCATAFQRLPEV
jgi:hypothetical protein